MKLIKNIVSLLNREMPIEILKKRGMKVGKNFSKQQGCFIDPSHCFLIEIGNNSIIGAGSIVTHDIPPDSVVAGNPAKIISTTEEYKMKLEKQLENSKAFSEDYTIRKNVDKIKKNELKDSTNKYGICFIK